jgi:16S rRNA (cytosine967-C5)-methyltransferase
VQNNFQPPIGSLALDHNAQPGTLSYALLGAAHLLLAVEQGQSLATALPALDKAWRLSPQDRGAIQSITYHALRHWGRARAVRQLLVTRQPKPALLRTYLDVVLACIACADAPDAPSYPPYVLVDQAVAGAHAHYELGHASGLINGVLRRWLRDGPALEADIARTPESLWNHPNWWVEKLALAYPDDWRAMLSLDAVAAPMTLRVNRRQGTRAEYLARLQSLNMDATEIGAHGLVLAQACPVERLPGFADGAVSVQDYGAQLAAELLNPQDGQRVLDACAAPGGKTAHLLEHADCHVTALDNDAMRLARVASGLERLQLSIRAHLIGADATQPASFGAQPESFDRILLDAPCSASGVVRRHPDIAWLRRSTDIKTLAQLQNTLLQALWPLLKPGGRLLYCTCSVFAEEGRAQAQQFAAAQPNARQIELNAIDHPCLTGLRVQDGQLLPSLDGASASHDGFFYALFEKL